MYLPRVCLVITELFIRGRSILWQNWDGVGWLLMSFVSCFIPPSTLCLSFQFPPFYLLSALLDLFCPRGLWEERLAHPMAMFPSADSCGYFEGGQGWKGVPSESDFILPERHLGFYGSDAGMVENQMVFQHSPSRNFEKDSFTLHILKLISGMF